MLKARGKKLTKTSALNKFTPYDIIVKPLMTEKSYAQAANDNKFSFKVHRDANKNDVKVAIQAIYGVTPVNVNTSIVPTKGRANRKVVRPGYKKAVITLKKWDTIDLVS